jgi:hypothetical protein
LTDRRLTIVVDADQNPPIDPIACALIALWRSNGAVTADGAEWLLKSSTGMRHEWLARDAEHVAPLVAWIETVVRAKIEAENAARVASDKAALRAVFHEHRMASPAVGGMLGTASEVRGPR